MGPGVADEYYQITHFMDDVSEDEEEEESLDSMMDNVNKTYVPVLSQSTSSQIETNFENGEKDKTAIRSLLNEELAKRLTPQVLIASKHKGLTDIVGPDVKGNEIHARNALDDPLDSAIIDKRHMMGAQGTNATKIPRAIPYQPNDKTRNVNLIQAELKNKLVEASKGLAISMKEVETITKSEITPDIKEPVCSTETLTNEIDNEVGSFQRVTHKTTDEHNNQQVHDKKYSTQSEQQNVNDLNNEITDEKKAAAVERSLNAANYLLQNWGFKNRTSIKRKKCDLEQLQYGKRSLGIHEVVFYGPN